MINKIRQIKYSRLNELEKYFIKLTDDYKIFNNYYVKNSDILFEIRKTNLYMNRNIYRNMYTLFIDIFGEERDDFTFESYISYLFKEYLKINIKKVVGINPPTQDYWETIVLF